MARVSAAIYDRLYRQHDTHCGGGKCVVGMKLATRGRTTTPPSYRQPTMVVPVLVAFGRGTPWAWRAALRLWFEKSKPGMVVRARVVTEEVDAARSSVHVHVHVERAVALFALHLLANRNALQRHTHARSPRTAPTPKLTLRRLDHGPGVVRPSYAGSKAQHGHNQPSSERHFGKYFVTAATCQEAERSASSHRLLTNVAMFTQRKYKEGRRVDDDARSVKRECPAREEGGKAGEVRMVLEM